MHRSAGYWKRQYASPARSDFDATTLQCYLDIAAYMSRVFNEVRDASTFDRAAAVLDDTFGHAVSTAEAVRLNPASTKSDLEQQKSIIERINLRDEK